MDDQLPKPNKNRQKTIGTLTDLTDYTTQVKFYQDNKNKEWKEWLEFETTFEKPGKQGLVGILKNKDHKFVFKISQYINYLAEHEYSVMKGLVDLSPYCPNFCKPIGLISCMVDAKCRREGNPFEIMSKHPVEKEVLLTELVEDSYKFYNYIRSPRVPDDVIYSIVKQVMLAVTFAQEKKKFTHYDLHSSNILVKRCDPDVVFLYVIDQNNQYCVPSHGHFPVIIDYGFSYIQDMENDYLWPSMSHTTVGFSSDRFDWVADPKLFLTTVSSEIKNKRPGKKAKKFRNIVKNMFGPLDIDWDSGWDNGGDKGASDYILEMLEDLNGDSDLFENYDHYCIDILQSLVILPLQPQSYTNMESVYTAFLKEFIKIEKEIGNSFYCLYVLKGMVDAARQVHSDYVKKATRKRALSYFRTSLYERIDCVAKFCNPKQLDVEKLLCTLLFLSRCIEGVLYDVMYPYSHKKEKQYSKLPLQSVQEMYGVLEVNIPTRYEFNRKTKVFVLDSVLAGCEVMSLDIKDIDKLNSTHPLCCGTYLYRKYMEK